MKPLVWILCDIQRDKCSLTLSIKRATYGRGYISATDAMGNIVDDRRSEVAE